MRTSVLAAIVTSLLVLGCKHKAQQNPPPTPGSGSGGSGSAGTGSGSSSSADIALPAGNGTPPVKTTKPLGRDTLKKISEIDYPGFKRVVRVFEDTTLEVRQTTDSRPRISVTVAIAPCGSATPAGSGSSAGSGSGSGSAAAAGPHWVNNGPCTPMQLEPWKARTEELKSIMSKSLRERPDTQWEIGTTDVHGEPMIFTYQLGQWFGVGEDGKQHGAFSDAYILYYNDGVNQIRVVAEYKDDPVATKDDLLKLAPREDLEKVGHAFLDAYTHAWS